MLQHALDIEATDDEAENRIPEMMAEAAEAAYRRALASGSKVLVTDSTADGRRFLYEVHPSGERRVVEEIEPLVRVRAGAIYDAR